MDFSEKLIETLADQLIRGYETTDGNGYRTTHLSPLQSMVNKEVNDKRELFVAEIAKVMSSAPIQEAVSKYIEDSLKSEWTLKAYQAKFVTHFKEVIEEEVVKDLKVLLAGKKINITIE